MHTLPENQPATLKGIAWFLFGGNAMASAFILPVHFFALLQMRTPAVAHPLFRLYFLILIAAALYHGLYRTYALCTDLGIGHLQSAIGKTCSVIFIAVMGCATLALFL